MVDEPRMATITVAEPREKLDAGETPIIFDLRSSAAVEQDPVLIQGAIHLSMDEIEKRQSEFPRDRDIILYCSCPNEVSSARLALRLQRKGFTRVRPLLGGIDAWRKQNYPMDQRAAVVVSTVGTGSANLKPAQLNTVGGLSSESPETKPPRPAEGETT